MISTPSSENCAFGAFGVKSSSHVSKASAVSAVAIAKMPIGHFAWPVIAEIVAGSGSSCRSPKPCSVGPMYLPPPEQWAAETAGWRHVFVPFTKWLCVRHEKKQSKAAHHGVK